MKKVIPSYEDFVNENFSFSSKKVDFTELMTIAKSQNWFKNPKQLKKDFPKIGKDVIYRKDKYKLEIFDDLTYIVRKKGKILFRNGENLDIIRSIAKWVFGIENGNQVLGASGFEYNNDYMNFGGLEKD